MPRVSREKENVVDISEAVRKLSTRLPLKNRQQSLTPALRELHRLILRAFHDKGCPLSVAELSTELGLVEIDTSLRTLADNDLIVRGSNGEIVGAYPFTTAETPHHLSFWGHRVNAMCAVDALAVAPMFGSEVAIDSNCEVTAEPIHISQDARRVVDAQPSTAVYVGIRWQTGGGAAADTL
jgi:mercuric reductase